VQPWQRELAQSSDSYVLDVMLVTLWC